MTNSMDVVTEQPLTGAETEAMMGHGWRLDNGVWWKMDDVNKLVVRKGGQRWQSDLAAVRGAK